MLLSRIELNPYRRETIRALSSPQVMHAAVMASFSSFDTADDDRVLWRVDKVGQSTYVLVQSRRRPDFTHMVEQFGKPGTGAGWETVDYDPFLDSLSEGDVLRFRLKANPTRSVMSQGKGGRGKIVAHVTAEQQFNWMYEKAGKLGVEFQTDDGNPSLEIVQRNVQHFDRQGKMITLGTATFEGVFIVVDADALRKGLTDGIGRAKAYGCGLMTVMRT